MAKKRSKSLKVAEPTRLIGYTRVSTDEQAESGYGLETQEAKIRHYAAALDKVLVDVVVDDGYSGTTTDRPGLQRVMDMLSNGEADGVIVAKLDRLSRNQRNTLNLLHELKDTGAAFVSVAEQFDTSTPTGLMMLQILGSFAEFEVNVITERLTGGRLTKASKGGYAGGRPPIGYKADATQGALIIDHDKARTVKRCMKLKADNPSWTLQQIADHLNEEGHSTAKGKRFHPVQVKMILDRRELYAGLYSYAGVTADGQHQAII